MTKVLMTVILKLMELGETVIILILQSIRSFICYARGQNKVAVTCQSN